MKPFAVSKNISHGDACAFRGNKLIKASRRTKRLAGVWVSADHKIIYTQDGGRYQYVSPTGLQTRGATSVNTYVRTN